MSMLNQMLNDIEKRQTNAVSEQNPVEGLSSVRPRRRTGPMLAVVLIAAGALAGVLAWQKYDKSPVPSATPQVLATMSPPAVEPVSVKPVPVEPVPLVLVVSAPPVPAAAPPAVLAVPAAVAVLKPAVVSAAKPQTVKPVAPVAAKVVAADAVDTPMQPKPVQKSSDRSPSSFKVVNSQQRSANYYRQAVSLMQKGQATDAQSALRKALEANASNHDARQLLSGVLIEVGHHAEAMELLRQGLTLAPGSSEFAMMLARLQVASPAKADALSTLERGLSAAGDNAEYQAFYATLLQGQERHAEAIRHFLTALRSNPAMPNWLIGVGISLQAENKLTDAAEAFQRAINTDELTPELRQFSEQRLKQLRQLR